MANKFLDSTGLSQVWAAVKNADTNVANAASAALEAAITPINTRLDEGTVNSATKDGAFNTITSYYVPNNTKGVANGVATLDSNGKIPQSQLPGYVDDVVEGYYYNSKFYAQAAHTTEITGETGKIYVSLDTNITYRWSGSIFTEISSSLALGETSSTAFAGNRGVAIETTLATPLNETQTANGITVGLGGTVGSPAITITSTKVTNAASADNSTKLNGQAASYYATAASVSALDTNKADKATTLAGYGITNAYTKAEVDTALNGKANNATTLAGYGITDAYTKSVADSTFAKLNNISQTIKSGDTQSFTFKAYYNNNGSYGSSYTEYSREAIACSASNFTITTANGDSEDEATYSFESGAGKGGTVAVTSDLATALTTAEINTILV